MNDFFALEVNYFLYRQEVLEKFSDEKLKDLKLDFLNENNDDGIMKISGDTAIIAIEGELVNKKSFWAQIFGMDQTQYSDISASLDSAANNSDVKKIQLHINSPGGVVNGILGVVDKIKSIDKPIDSMVNLCCSGAYWIASNTDSITATNALSTIGSIGVITTFYDDKKMLDNAGYKEIVLTSTKAPNKHADPATKKGQDIIKSRLDDIHNVFAKSVAEGRGVSVSKVNSDFGKGGVMLSEKALQAGMIDLIMIFHNNDSTNDNGKEKNKNDVNGSESEEGKNKKEVIMDIRELKLEHSDLYAQVFDLGVKTEKERIEKLNNWTSQNPETKEVVDRAISEGKTAEDVLPELMATVKMGAGTTEAAETEGADEISQAQTKEKDKKKEDEIDFNGLAKEAMAKI